MEEQNKDLLQDEELEDGEVVQLINEDGDTVEFYHVATIEYENNWYVFFQPAEEMEDIGEDEVVIFKLDTDENGEDLFVPIEDEELLDKVFDEYNKLMEDDGEEDGCSCGCGCGLDCDCKNN